MRPCLFALAVIALPALAQEDAAPLRYRFEEGATVRTRETASTEQSTVAGGVEGKMTIRQTIEFRRRIAGVDESGTATLDSRVESVQVEAETPMGDESYDSTDPASKPGPIGRAIAPLLGLSMSARVGPTGDVDAGDLAAVFQAKGIPNAQAAADSQKQSLEINYPKLPETPTRPGDRWTRDVTVPAPPLGSLVFHMHYTYRGVEQVAGRPCDRFDYTIEIEFSAPPSSGAPGKPQGARAEGSVAIDRATGLQLAAETRIDMTLDLEMQAPSGKRTLRQRTVQEQKCEVVPE